MKYLIRGVAACALLLLMSGCATTRSVMRLKVPASGSAVLSGGQPLVIDSVQDVREFEADRATRALRLSKKAPRTL
jgi:hypothetical protein